MGETQHKPARKRNGTWVCVNGLMEELSALLGDDAPGGRAGMEDGTKRGQGEGHRQHT